MDKSKPSAGAAPSAPAATGLAGPLLVACAAILWSTDQLFRVPALQDLHPVMLVFGEHLIALLVLGIPLLVRSGPSLFKVTTTGFLLAIITGVMGSALGTVFFTASFKFINPSITILIQKLQPVIVVLLAMLFLREKPKSSFFWWAAVALGAAALLIFPEFKITDLRSMNPDAVTTGRSSQGVIYALLAAGCWAVATVAGKAFTNRAPALQVTFLRYFIGTITLWGMLAINPDAGSVTQLLHHQVARPLLYIALVSGLAAMVFYYHGLKRTPASATTFIELLFPVSAIALNTVFLNAPLSTLQILASSILLFAVVQVTRTSK